MGPSGCIIKGAVSDVGGFTARSNVREQSEGGRVAANPVLFTVIRASVCTPHAAAAAVELKLRKRTAAAAAGGRSPHAIRRFVGDYRRFIDCDYCTDRHRLLVRIHVTANSLMMRLICRARAAAATAATPTAAGRCGECARDLIVHGL
ncbi:hypothetical protein JYU34_017828 [Plutella xylostella]|uniref:Uncharacterized protein n=1 Tax=Plutella xylostella TaxID=51655 RepID=A0ABQ7Q219_PLUXY|nr:hypothetical protein JYU34_017828 [Plutella xylostella]